MKELTARQQEILNLISQHIAQTGFHQPVWISVMP